MNTIDPSAPETLRRLLEEQHRDLRRVADKVGSLYSMGLQQTQHSEWSGASRQAHDDLVERMLEHVTSARDALEMAADETARAMATMATRVG